jgi:hypothetical protein
MLRHYFAVGLVGLGALLLAASLVYWRYTEALASPDDVAVPGSLAGERLTQQEAGVEAVEDITRLHGKEFPISAGAMGLYGGGAATLWVSGSPAAPMAAAMVRAMRDKIAEGRSPFTLLGTRSLSGSEIYELTGMGQSHFYFQAGALVVWLAADEALAEAALQEALTFYQGPDGE